MAVDILIGLQWGDEGKGKVVDVLANNYNVIARFQGGPNAGHTLEFDGKKLVLHTIPSGIFHEKIVNVIGNGVVIDPISLKKEIELIQSYGVNVKKSLIISKRANLILPSHRMLDASNEAFKGALKIGSTLKGIGPTYTDKIARHGLRIGEIYDSNFKEKYEKLKQFHILSMKAEVDFNLDPEEEKWFEAIEFLKQYNISYTEYFINEALNNGNNILAEGAQGSLLDIEFGTYPYVTSSNTISASACIGLGFAPQKIRDVYGIVKAYTTRVGNGPFPTELNDEIGKRIQTIGNEFGSTTGRARRCGWLDLPALKYSIMLSGVTKIILTKSDILNEFDCIKACKEYITEDGKTNIFPINIENITPVYEEIKAWNSIYEGDKINNDLLNYIKYLESNLNVEIPIISTGPNRKDIIFR